MTDPVESARFHEMALGRAQRMASGLPLGRDLPELNCLVKVQWDEVQLDVRAFSFLEYVIIHGKYLP
jgi:hypothetical protein